MKTILCGAGRHYDCDNDACTCNCHITTPHKEKQNMYKNLTVEVKLTSGATTFLAPEHVQHFLSRNPGAVVVAPVSTMNCDFCNKPATVDGKTKLGPWAGMCDEHFRLYGTSLGTGKGQKLS